MRTDTKQHVIIVGAGPVGLVTANLLADGGIAVSLVETCEDLPHDLRASTFHPPTLDMLERFVVVGRMIEQGLICPTWQFRDRNEGVIATFELARLSSDTNHPYRLQCEQWRLGELLYARLKESPLATVRLGTRAVAAGQSADGVELDVRLPDGGTETIHGTFLVGADGISSVVRNAIGA
jgi:3-(3-hydroxy-phenyl)propionate hydroxylase